MGPRAVYCCIKTQWEWRTQRTHVLLNTDDIWVHKDDHKDTNRKRVVIQKPSVTHIEFGPCPECEGTGEISGICNRILCGIWGKSQCAHCNGKGERNVSVTKPSKIWYLGSLRMQQRISLYPNEYPMSSQYEMTPQYESTDGTLWKRVSNDHPPVKVE